MTTNLAYDIYLYERLNYINRILIFFVMNKYQIDNKWGKETLKLGFVPIPTSLIFAQKELALSSIEINILLNLLVHWWEKDQYPFPSQQAIAYRVGISTRTVQRTLAGLELKGLIKRKRTSRENEKYKGRNLYDLSPLVTVLEEKTPELKIYQKKDR